MKNDYLRAINNPGDKKMIYVIEITVNVNNFY